MLPIEQGRYIDPCGRFNLLFANRYFLWAYLVLFIAFLVFTHHLAFFSLFIKGQSPYITNDMIFSWVFTGCALVVVIILSVLGYRYGSHQLKILKYAPVYIGELQNQTQEFQPLMLTSIQVPVHLLRFGLQLPTNELISIVTIGHDLRDDYDPQLGVIFYQSAKDYIVLDTDFSLPCIASDGSLKGRINFRRLIGAALGLMGFILFMILIKIITA